MHLVPALFDERDGILGGAERYVFELARHMADAIPTTLVTFGHQAREERAGALRIKVIGNPWYVRGQTSNPVARALFDQVRRATVIHCHQNHILASSLSAIAARLLGKRRVFCTDLGGGGFDLSSFMSTDCLYDGHLHISEYSRQIAGHHGKSWAHIIGGGVDAMKFAPGPDRPHAPRVLFVGRLLPHKGVDVLLRALPSDMPAEIVGGVFNETYASELRTLATDKSVTFIHDCNDTALVQAYQRASCIVLPSVYDDRYGGHTDVPELLGQTLLEGMACGTPAICTSVGSLPEVVEHDVCGFVVPPNDPDALRTALKQLHADPSSARAMGVAARTRVTTRFTWRAVVQRCLECYHSSRSDAPRAKTA